MIIIYPDQYIPYDWLLEAPGPRLQQPALQRRLQLAKAMMLKVAAQGFWGKMVTLGNPQMGGYHSLRLIGWLVVTGTWKLMVVNGG